MNLGPNRFRSRSNRDASESHDKTVQSYSDTALAGAIRDLTASVASGNARTWERLRLSALKAERGRRNRKRRGKVGA